MNYGFLGLKEHNIANIALVLYNAKIVNNAVNYA
jgi:hypothetical protein